MDQMNELIAALREYTAATHELIDSNTALIQAMAESEDMGDESGPDTDLEGNTLD